MHPIIASHIAADHHRAMLADAQQARLARAARAGSKTLTTGRRPDVRRTRFHPAYALHRWIAGAGRSQQRSLPAA
ncbi:MAG: hypothetical protein QOG01_206 [Pseudonocardiales bacterium]|jgi:hypothetical protein|nr:hypothetical protein [Pseudonocardiales bacterium]